MATVSHQSVAQGSASSVPQWKCVLQVLAVQKGRCRPRQVAPPDSVAGGRTRWPAPAGWTAKLHRPPETSWSAMRHGSAARTASPAFRCFREIPVRRKGKQQTPASTVRRNRNEARRNRRMREPPIEAPGPAEARGCLRNASSLQVGRELCRFGGEVGATQWRTLV
jgi:hypothetical protein